MPNLYKITIEKENTNQTFTKGEILSIAYHNVFDFPLTISEMIRWKASDELSMDPDPLTIGSRDGYYFKEEKYVAVYKRLLRSRISKKKTEIARRISGILSLIPTIKMVAITGSLAMENADDESDIDLMIITRKGTLWTSRLFSYMAIHAFGFSPRKPNDSYQKDKLCLNIWLDESDLAWQDGRNIYTAHEIAQTVPLVNKDNTYERFLDKNRWILSYWPNSVKIRNPKRSPQSNSKFKTNIVEKLAFQIQYRHMKSKITRETVTSTRALFHPQDLSEIVLSRLSS